MKFHCVIKLSLVSIGLQCRGMLLVLDIETMMLLFKFSLCHSPRISRYLRYPP